MPIKPRRKQLSFVKVRKPFERERKHQHLYNSWKWKKLRKLFLQSNPLCITCDSKGLKVVATVVDHVIRYKEGDDFWDESNWQPLCKKCHDRKSSHESRGMG